MLFNSHLFIFVFLPLLLICHAVFIKYRKRYLVQALLIAASFVFYGWGSANNIYLLICSIVVNYFIGCRIIRTRSLIMVWVGTIYNLLILFYYKYIDFFIDNINALFAWNVPNLEVVLPLGISFYTFEQIFFLYDCYKSDDRKKSIHILDYVLFLSYFPRLIAGHIVRFQEVVSQYPQAFTRAMSWENLAQGLFLFSVGLFKKICIADMLASYVNKGFDETLALNFVEGWATSLFYTFQLYFDFSGYADMAIGVSLMFGIKLPMNFNSPYLSLDIQDFWRRWHMTLGRFVRECLYIPLGGSQQGLVRTCVNLLIVFLVIGLWHGAGWLFIFWGLLHGLATVGNRIWQKKGWTMPAPAAWALTFLFVNMAWVFFRAKTWFDATKILQAMAGFTLFDNFTDFASLEAPAWKIYTMLSICLSLALMKSNSMSLADKFKPNFAWAAFSVGMLFLSFFGIYDKQSFLYFNF